MTGRPGLLLIREGQYALALLQEPSAISGVQIQTRVTVQGDVVPGALGLLLVDAVLVSAGVQVPGVTLATVVEP